MNSYQIHLNYQKSMLKFIKINSWLKKKKNPILFFFESICVSFFNFNKL